MNEFRPHQARETIRTVIEHQTKQKKEAEKNIHIALEKSKSTLSYCQEKLNQCLASRPQYTMDCSVSSSFPMPPHDHTGHHTATLQDFSAERELQDEMIMLSSQLEAIIHDPGVM